jgi:hypothetical protein
MKRHLLGLVATNILLAMSLPAHAGTETFYMHGSLCSGTPPRDEHIQWGATSTNAGITETYLCPFFTRELYGVTRATLTVRGYDRNAQDNLSCTLTATDIVGNVLAASENHVATASKQGGQSFTLAIDGLDADTAKFFLITCNVPGPTAEGLSHVSSLVLQLTTAD